MVVSLSTESRKASVPAGTVTYLEAGQGPALVLLHGIGSSARSFAVQIGAFPGYRTIAWNAPGYGGSTALPMDAPSAGDYAGVLLALLDHLGVTDCHLLGHSLGCLMAARFAADHPDRVRTLTLASIAAGHARLPAEERARMLAGRVGDVDELGPRGMAEKRGPRLLGPDASAQHVRAVVDTMASIDPRGYAQAARMLSGGDIVADLDRLPPELPVRIFFGTSDVITPPAANLRVAATIPRAGVVTIEHAGHALYVEKAEAFNAALAAFIEEHHDRR